LLAQDFSIAPQMLRNRCNLALDAAAGGTLLISDVEQLAPTVQGHLLEMLQDLESARAPLAALRLVSDTTVSLLDHIACGECLSSCSID
jgi:DNA-binding NtrC family response regulator